MYGCTQRVRLHYSRLRLRLRRALPREGWGRWGPVGRNTGWRGERLSFAYFSLPRQRKVGAAPHRGNTDKPEAQRGCQRKPNQTTTQSPSASGRRIPPGIGNNSIERNIMRFTQQRICTARFIRDAHRHGHLAPVSAEPAQRAVVVPATVSKPISIGIEPDTRHEQQIRHDDFAGGRLVNSMRADLHRHLRRPDMKFERFGTPRDDGQSSAPRGIARKPHTYRIADIELTR